MHEDLNDPNELRKHAAHCVALANSTANIDLKRDFMSIANDWAERATELEVDQVPLKGDVH